jgi:hypothetical protein
MIVDRPTTKSTEGIDASTALVLDEVTSTSRKILLGHNMTKQ